MPFSVTTKTEMFIRSGRLCPLCLKQCGNNMEAAHIISEKDDGSDDADNGIPVCFDCHEEIGSYNEDHPKGNKIRPEELRARRDRLYKLVETGVIYAQVVAEHARARGHGNKKPAFPEEPRPSTPSAEANRFLKAILSSEDATSGVARKLSLLNERDRAHILDELVRKATTEKQELIRVIGEIVRTPTFPRNEAILVAEQIVRAMTLYGDVSSKTEFLQAFPTDIISAVYEGLRLIFFEDIISIVKRDQFHEVNKIVPPFVDHVDAIPGELHKDYVLALLGQARSSAYTGAPAAQKALRALPENVAKAGVLGIDKQFVFWHEEDEALREFIKRFGHFGSAKQQTVQRPLELV